MGGLSETENKAISASIEIEVEFSCVEAELGNNDKSKVFSTYIAGCLTSSLDALKTYSVSAKNVSMFCQAEPPVNFNFIFN